MKIRVLFFFACVAFTASAQQLAVVKINSEVLIADVFVGYDNFGYEYFIKDNVFCKKTGNAVLEYKNLSLGKITRADIRNPLQMVLFYENFNTAVLLDNQLNETQQVKFSEHTTPIVASAVGMGSANRLWVFNSLSQKIGLFDYVRNDYREITVPFTGKISLYESDFNYFQWLDDRAYRFGTDIYGKVTEYGQTMGCNQVSLAIDDWCFCAKDGKLYAQDEGGDFKLYTVAIPEKTFKSFHYQAQILSIFTKQEITNYKITLP